jgi:hypothetical protein
VLFPPDLIVRTEDLVGLGKLFANEASLRNARLHFGFPSGRLVGRLRTNTGAEVNAWWEARPTAPQQLPSGFGGAQRRTGRRRGKLEQPPPHAA